ncbi:MAG: chloride channel protein [Gammaproteobacteria bacterium]|nr:chloride channel protein [Gammaproteobacteria bacterium]
MVKLTARLLENRSVLYLALIAIVLGVFASFGTRLFIMATQQLAELLWPGTNGLNQFVDIGAIPAWARLSVPVVGGLLVGLLVYWLPDRRYHGISDVMEAVAARGGRMNARSGVGAIAAATISLSSGASMGREGPAVHFAASFAAYLSELLKLSPRQTMTLLGCASAAAVSTAFNAPLAGALFAMEVVVGQYSMAVFAPIALATTAGYFATLSWDHLETWLPVEYTFDWSASMLWQMLLVGLVCGIAAQSFIALTRRVGQGLAWLALPAWLKPASAGLIVGGLGLLMPEVLGVGEGAIADIVDQRLAGSAVVFFLLIKLLATATSVAGGFCGGVFAPSLALGAAIGASLVFVLNQFGWAVDSQLFVVIAMASMAGAVLGAPISTLVMAIELTKTYDFLLPAMIGIGVSSLVMQIGEHRSFFRWQLAGRGVDLAASRDRSVLNEISVEEIIREQPLVELPQSVSVQSINRAFFTAKVPILVGQHDRAYWMIDLPQWRQVATDLPPDAMINLENWTLVSLRPSATLTRALEVFGDSELAYLPIIDRHGVYRGVVGREQIWRRAAQGYASARKLEHGVN